MRIPPPSPHFSHSLTLSLSLSLFFHPTTDKQAFSFSHCPLLHLPTPPGCPPLSLYIMSETISRFLQFDLAISLPEFVLYFTLESLLFLGTHNTLAFLPIPLCSPTLCREKNIKTFQQRKSHMFQMIIRIKTNVRPCLLPSAKLYHGDIKPYSTLFANKGLSGL